jgi:hypothetical protein
MVGDWSGPDGDGIAEEHWTAARGGTMLGTNRTTKGDATTFFEFLRITSDANGVVYWGAPLGKNATPFKLVKVDGARAVFENSEHDYPQRILYARDGATLTARVEGRENGVDKSSEWRFSPMLAR